ncbi:MAG: YbhB/YbcL family Raf kinase inhibitor-like protein [Myxococcales bacterium]
MAFELTSKTLREGQPIPAVNAMGVPGEGGPVPGPNRSPHLAWSGAPAGTQSFAVICVDLDAPTKPDDVNKSDRTVPYALARADFFHWVLVDIPKNITELSEGLDADGLVAGGKAPERRPYGLRGLNDYTGWFATDEAMAGHYAGYDGPWPPFNDERRHRYVFHLFALDVESLGLSGHFGGADARRAMRGRVLGETTIKTTYAIYPKAR